MMKKRLLSILLVLCMVLALLPVTARAAETLPDWHFLFAILKSVDADCTNKDGVTTHVKYTMKQEEVDLAREHAKWFEEFMSGVGVMRAHVDVVEINTPVTELAESAYGAYLTADQAAPLLEGKVDLDRYDHVTSIVNFTVQTGAGGMTDLPFENGTGHSSINFVHSSNTSYVQGAYVHEFLHFMEDRSGALGAAYDLHGIIEKFYKKQYSDISGLTDIILNRVKGNAKTGTGVSPMAWQYPPRVLRATRELNIPSGVTSIGYSAFYRYSNLESVVISNGVASIGDYAFNSCGSMKSVTIPASVTSIGYSTFGNTSVKDVYYSGTEAQWKRISIGEYNSGLLKATIHYNNPMPGTSTTPSTPSTPTTPSAPVPTSVVLSPQKLAVNGKNVNCEKYNIDGSNYFKLRDLAQVLNGTSARFEVGYDAAASTVSITTGAAYTPAGGELAVGVDNSNTAQPSSQAILINGVRHGELTVYNIGGSNFFQLRELGNILGFEVGYDVSTNTATVRSARN